MMDFLIELFSDFSPMYMYLSVLLSVICAFQWMPVVANHLYRDTQIDIHGIQNSRIEQVPSRNGTNEVITRRNWIAIITKRIEIPDEDEDANASSTNLSNTTKLGGTTCKNLYSLSLKNQVSLAYLSY